MKKLVFGKLERNQFNILGQQGTEHLNKKPGKAIVVKGKGSDLKDLKLLQNRGKKKMVTQTTIKALLKVAEKKGNKGLMKSLWNGYRCLNTITTGEGRMYTTRYCKSRFCTICLGNRKAELINKYLPIIRTWEAPYFVTLTVKSIYAKHLNKWINEGMIRGFQKITAKFQKRDGRGKGTKLIGVRALECCFNPTRRTYNPHFHIIVPNKRMAETLISEWLLLWRSEKKVFTTRAAQHMRPIVNLEQDLVETIKYGSKIFTQPDPAKLKKKKGSEKLYAVALYNILNAMKGRRLFEHFGFDIPASLKKTKNEPITLNDPIDWKYQPKKLDWENAETERKLINFLPDPQFAKMCGEIDFEVE